MNEKLVSLNEGTQLQLGNRIDSGLVRTGGLSVQSSEGISPIVLTPANATPPPLKPIPSCTQENN